MTSQTSYTKELTVPVIAGVAVAVAGLCGASGGIGCVVAAAALTGAGTSVALDALEAEYVTGEGYNVIGYDGLSSALRGAGIGASAGVGGAGLAASSGHVTSSGREAAAVGWIALVRSQATQAFTRQNIAWYAAGRAYAGPVQAYTSATSSLISGSG